MIAKFVLIGAAVAQSRGTWHWGWRIVSSNLTEAYMEWVYLECGLMPIYLLGTAMVPLSKACLTCSRHLKRDSPPTLTPLHWCMLLHVFRFQARVWKINNSRVKKIRYIKVGLLLLGFTDGAHRPVVHLIWPRGLWHAGLSRGEEVPWRGYDPKLQGQVPA